MAARSTGSITVDLATLKPFPGNAKRHDDALLQESLSTLAQYRPIVVSRSDDPDWDGVILAGNGTADAAHTLGWKKIAVTYVDGDETLFRKINLVDNRATEKGWYDDEALLALLQHDGLTLTGTGYNEDDIAALLASLDTAAPPTALTDPDDVPDVPDEATCKVGQVWVCGPHRLAVGDSTDPVVVDRLMDGELADIVWTDPPYGVAYQDDLDDRDAVRLHRRRDGLKVANDNLTSEGLRDFLTNSLGLAYKVTKPGGVWYVASPSGEQQTDFGIVLRHLGMHKQTIIWVKDRFAFGRSDYHYRHETIFFGWKKGAAHHAVPDRKQDTVWEFDKPQRSPEHPTMKPVALVARALENSTDLAEIVLDPFGGSGTTMIAAHGTGRVARLIELDPRYADVILRRYREHTGVEPVLLGV